MKRTDLFFAIYQAASDLAMFTFAFVLAYFLRLSTEVPAPQNIAPLSGYLRVIVIYDLTLLVTFAFYKLYFMQRSFSRLDELYYVFVAVSVGTVAAIAVSALVLKSEYDPPRLMLAYMWLLTIFFVFSLRVINGFIMAVFRAHGWDQHKVLIIGGGSVGRRIMHTIRESPELGYRVVGFIDNDPGLKEVEGVPVCGGEGCIVEAIREKKVDEVIIALPHAPHQEIISLVSLCGGEKVSVRVYPDVFQMISSEVSIGDLSGMPLVSIRDAALRGWRLGAKRIIDLVFSVAFLVIFSPLLLFMALLIKLDSPGPVFYVQERVGLDGKPFQVIKFRSMKADAEANGPGWTTANDPRRTRLGTFLRRFSIDEMPQFINVLLGEMSVVGPRPERPVYVEQFRKQVPRYMDRHWEKAGVTGWAQVNGLRGDTSIEERTRYDLYYIENWSLLLDFKIILRTIWVALSGKNAY